MQIYLSKHGMPAIHQVQYYMHNTFYIDQLALDVCGQPAHFNQM